MTAGVPSARAPIPGGRDDRPEDVLREMREAAERVAITASFGVSEPLGGAEPRTVPTRSGALAAGATRNSAPAATAGVAGVAGHGGGAVSASGPPSPPHTGRTVFVALLVFGALFAALAAGKVSQDGAQDAAVADTAVAGPSSGVGQATDTLEMGALAAPATIDDPTASKGWLPVGDASGFTGEASFLVAFLDDGDVVAASVDGAQVATAVGAAPPATTPQSPDLPAPPVTPPAAEPDITSPVPPADVEAATVVDAAIEALVALGVQDVSVEFESGVLLVRGTLPDGGGELDYATELDGIATAFSAVAGVEGVVARLVMSGGVAALDETPEHLAGVARLTDVASAAESDALLSIAEARVIMQEYEAAVSADRVRAPAAEHRPAKAEATR